MLRGEADTMFQDRADAARRLARRLQAFQGQHPLVLAIPRGAVPMGRVIARQLGGELDVVLARKASCWVRVSSARYCASAPSRSACGAA